MRIIDLRSDTITKPTKSMLDAMLNAKVGDDGYREDPTVNSLEELAAELLGKQAALFLPSGTMGNQVAVLAHTLRGDEIIAEANSHIVTHEMAGPAVISSVLVRSICGDQGVLDPIKVKALIRPRGTVPRTSLLCIENTHNKEGGTVTSLERMKELIQLAKENGIAVHVDGARIFNASVVAGVPPSKLVADADSVMCSLSKGLSAPAGAILAGNREFISHARIQRKMMGGGMRQVGYLAAAGIVALNTMVDRLEEDHQKAKCLAMGLKNIQKIDLDFSRVQTNIVIFNVQQLKVEQARFVSELEHLGVRAYYFPNGPFRMVVHRHISHQDIDEAVSVVAKVVRLCTYGT